MEPIYAVTYRADGTILTVGRIHSGYADRTPTTGLLYTTEIPEDTDILNHYKIQNGVFVYDPVETEEEPYLPYTARMLHSLQEAQNDTDAMAVDQEYRLTLLELGV